MTMTRPLPKKLIAKLLTEDVRKADAEAEAKHNVIPNTGNPQLVSQTVNYPAMEKIEGDYVAQMFELRTRLKQAQEAEQRLRTNRNEWRAVAEHLQHSASKGGTDEEGHEETDEVEENSVHPSDSPTDLGPGGGGVVEATAEAHLHMVVVTTMEVHLILLLPVIPMVEMTLKSPRLRSRREKPTKRLCRPDQRVLTSTAACHSALQMSRVHAQIPTKKIGCVGSVLHSHFYPTLKS